MVLDYRFGQLCFENEWCLSVKVFVLHTKEQMGNYQEYLRNIPSPLRELDADQPRRLHTFGNPFKLDKKGMMIDEADEFVSGHQKHKRPGEPSMMGIPKRRRCMSPLLRGRPASPVANNHIGGKGPPSLTQGSTDSPKTEDGHKHAVVNNSDGKKKSFNLFLFFL
ncbi:integrator complex subunit 6-A-like [Pyxicephalus adspersus]|uniref:integrator complex subunit 6-A-like n=1 Tax=Pyxicephalus adspersus TaxID=30357 RepID=UPI003B5A8944